MHELSPSQGPGIGGGDMHLPTNKLKNISRTGIRKIFDKAKAYEREGRKIIHMEIGRPDFDTPHVIKEEAVRSLREGNVHYTSNYGMEELKEAIAEKLKEDNGLEVDPEREILVTAGAVEGSALSMMSLLDAGEEVLIPSPAYSSYHNQALHPGGVPVAVPLRRENAFKPLLCDLEARVTSKTKMLVLNTPHNPTGAVYERAVLEDMAAFAQKHDLLVLSDECYEDFVYEGEHVSIAGLPGMKERTITVNSTSKAFSMTGWRVGFVSAAAEIIEYMIRIHQDLVICPCSFAQAGAALAYRRRKEIIPPMMASFARRRNLVIERLDRMEGIDYMRPAGGFYVFPSIQNFGLGDWEFCDYLMDEAGVAVVPGSSFGSSGEGFIRMAYSCSLEDLEAALSAMQQALKKLS